MTKQVLSHKLLFPLILSAVLLGCACPTPTVEYRVVKGPKPPVIEQPVLAPATTNQEKATALSEYITKLKAALQDAITALKVYE